MIIKLGVTFVGKETKISKKDANKTYGIATFMDGADPVQAYVDNLAIFDTIVPFKEGEASLEIKMGKYPRCNLVAYVPVTK